MRVLITGGAGFIGSHVADRLLAQGHHVLVIDTYATGRRENLTPQPGLRVVEGTIADAALVARAFGEFSPDRVIHAAASYKDPDDWLEDSLTNVVGTANVVQGARRAGVARLIYFQTALCYGLHPMEQPITLAHPLRPEGSSYAISKTTGEHYVALSGLDFVSLRLANAYGPRNLSGPLPTFYHRLTTHQPCFVADTRRDFLYIDDLVNLVMLALEERGERGFYHVSSGADVSIKEIFDATVRALGIVLDHEVAIRPRHPDDAYTILLDPSKTERDFGWRAQSSFAAGVAAAVAWYQGHSVSRTFTHLPQGERGR
ncbi:MAG: NAD-dependent epimerase/dehydratase family protein [Candidatus Rokuibacteriota bacterium]